MAQGVIDTKLLGKNVREFSGRDVDWPDWSFQFENYAGAVSSEMLEHMERARTRKEEIKLATMEAPVKQHAANLAYILVGLVKGEMAKVFRKLEKGNGFEMWRKMCARYDPKDRNTRRGLMTAIMHYDFSTDRLDSLPEKLAEFEVLVQQYDDLASPEECSDDVKITAVLETIPEPMKGHFELNTDLSE